ncbi:hypothetical protein G6F61_015179 [Rhizopus arrhizus]|nr:hypothetical protein G6F61_015179 [Rhizopus arrhizus]
MVLRVPPFDVLGGFEKREPPVQHAALAAVQVGARGHHQSAAGQPGDARFQAQGGGVQQGVDVCQDVGIVRVRGGHGEAPSWGAPIL